MKNKLINGFPFIAHHNTGLAPAAMLQASEKYYRWMDMRRSCRDFSARPVAKEVIGNILLTASTAPSGAHKQPWTFCVVSDAAIKKQIRMAAEQEEKESYDNRMSDEWLKDLAPIGTDWQKPFLETAPYLIVVFSRSYETEANGHKHQNYYVKESVGIACGFLLAAIHNAGLVALTHTPSPMNFLSQILQRPANEKPFLMIPVGYAADECWVPDIKRKSLEEVAVFY